MSPSSSNIGSQTLDRLLNYFLDIVHQKQVPESVICSSPSISRSASAVPTGPTVSSKELSNPEQLSETSTIQTEESTPPGQTSPPLPPGILSPPSAVIISQSSMQIVVSRGTSTDTNLSEIPEIMSEDADTTDITIDEFMEVIPQDSATELQTPLNYYPMTTQ